MWYHSWGQVRFASLPARFYDGSDSFLDRLRGGLDRVAGIFRPKRLYATSLHGGLNTILRAFSSLGAVLGANPAFSTATVPTGGVGNPTPIGVQTIDALGRPLTIGGDVVAVAVSGANTATPAVTDNGDGTYSATYTPTVAGTDQVAITLNGAPLVGSPFTSIVNPPMVCVCATGGGEVPTYPTLTTAFAGVATGGVVQVCDGVHDAELLTIDRAVTLEPESGASVTMQGQMLLAHPAGTVAITGFTFDFDGPAVTASGAYADVVLDDLTFMASSVTSCL